VFYKDSILEYLVVCYWCYYGSLFVFFVA